MAPLTAWVVSETVRQAAAWAALDGPGGTAALVNVAAEALEGDELVGLVADRLRAAALPPGRLVLEVTEGAIADGGRALETLEALRGLGLRVAVDDFGAGHSSLGRLRELPLDLLKVDRAFLAAPDARGEAILRAVVALAEGLGVPTVAEGVETAEQLAEAADLGCALAQGFHIGRPVPADELARRMPPRRRAPGALAGRVN
jgi:EAL domain-containing protein (putative c-di-GMP-specific phosphodiesterase class I)